MIGILCVAVAMATVTAGPVKQVAIAQQCEYNNVKYSVGQKIDKGPCQPCFCSPGGSIACAIIDCAPPMCVDAVRPTGQCCTTCPNGYNCRNGNVTISKGEVYHPDPQTTCTCHSGFGFFNPSLEAICVKSGA